MPSGRHRSAPVLKDGFFRRLVLHALGFEGKVDHHGVFLHDALKTYFTHILPGHAMASGW